MEDLVSAAESGVDPTASPINETPAQNAPEPKVFPFDMEDEETNFAQLEAAHAPLIPFEEVLNLLGLSSPAKSLWKLEKNDEHSAFDELLDMIGLENIKNGFLDLRHRVGLTLSQGADVRFDRLGTVLVGNPGTGKTTVARLFGRFLTSIGALEGDQFNEYSASRLLNKGVNYCQDELEDLVDNGGGVFFIDDAHQLAAAQSSAGREIINFLLNETEAQRGHVIFVLAGYAKEMDALFACDRGLPGRFPNRFDFEDYTEKELAALLALKLRLRSKNTLRLEDGEAGLSTRIVARRISRGRGQIGFANARAIENVVTQIAKRQAQRVQAEKRESGAAEYRHITVVDMIGPKPVNALSTSQAWNELQSMIGLQSVKDSVRALVNTLSSNYQRELNEQSYIQVSLNRVFLGNPGTGKTSVAKLYGRILADIGMLSDGAVIIKNPSDFVGSALGESEANTRAILAASMGKVLVIDEAYGLHSSTGSQPGVADPYRAAVIDTIVSEVQSAPGDDRCVLLLGYRAQMEAMFQSSNPGFSRRFPMDSAFEFEDFDDQQLLEILNFELKKQDYHASDAAKKVAIDCLARMRNRPNFGNAGALHILLDAAKLRHQKRNHTGQRSEEKSTLIEKDFDPDFDRVERSDSEVALLFKDVVGCEALIEKFTGYQITTRFHQKAGLDPKEQIPFNFVFRGPPGTGKTTTARKIGKLFYDIGLLSTSEVVECSVSDLVGKFVGHTGPRTKHTLERALGKVLFIDEAYRLADGPFAAEAVDELVDCVTKPNFYQKLIIILAGYDKNMNRLMNCNPGLASRFSESVSFPSLLPEQCYELLWNLLSKKLEMYSKALPQFDAAGSRPTTPDPKILRGFSMLTDLAHWANGRDVELLAKRVMSRVLKAASAKPTNAFNFETFILKDVDELLRERRAMAQESGLDSRAIDRLSQFYGRVQDSAPPMADYPQIRTATRTKKAIVTKTSADSDDSSDQDDEAKDVVTPPSDQEPDKGNEGTAKDTAAGQTKLQTKIEEKAEEQVQELLKDLGPCPAGYTWLKTEVGYRCAGGTHFMTNEQVADLRR